MAQRSGIVLSPCLRYMAQLSRGWSLNVCILCIRRRTKLLSVLPHQVDMLHSHSHLLVVLISS